jgi:hypothetical protein
MSGWKVARKDGLIINLSNNEKILQKTSGKAEMALLFFAHFKP